MKILYIPFSLEDAFYDLEAKATMWQKEYKNKGKEVAVIYHDSPAVVQQQHIQKALHAGSCQIYILSHGIDRPDLIVANQTKSDEEYKEMTIKEVAERFKTDLVNEGFSSNNIVKLYFCDAYAKNNKPRKMAQEFRDQLAKSLKTMEIKYYSDVNICPPGIGVSDALSAKEALRSFPLKNDFFCFNLLCPVGRVREFRQGLNVIESRSTAHPFFAGTSKPIHYPEYSHVLLKQLAQQLVQMIQNDNVLAKNKSVIIDELLLCLPRTISEYLVDSLSITGKTMKFEMRINLEKLNDYLIKNKVIIKPITPIVDTQKAKQSWIDEEDYSEEINTSSFERLHLGSFLALTDYQEILDMEEQLEHKASLT